MTQSETGKVNQLGYVSMGYLCKLQCRGPDLIANISLFISFNVSCSFFFFLESNEVVPKLRLVPKQTSIQIGFVWFGLTCMVNGLKSVGS